MTHEERILAELAKRLQRVLQANGYATDAGQLVEVDPEDRHADDQGAYPCIAILPGDVVSLGRNRVSHQVEMPIVIRGYTQAEPVLDPDAPPEVQAIAERQAAYVLFRDLMKALFPADAALILSDDLGGTCKTFDYSGHAIYTRDDGNKTTAVYIDCNVEYVLHTSNPDK